MQTSIQISLRDSEGVTKQKSFAYINPSATSAELVAFARGIVSLSDDTYVKTTRINKIDCDNEEGNHV